VSRVLRIPEDSEEGDDEDSEEEEDEDNEEEEDDHEDDGIKMVVMVIVRSQ